MDKYVYENVKMYCRYYLKDAVAIYEKSSRSQDILDILIELKDGTLLSYCDVTKETRIIPDIDSMTEKEFESIFKREFEIRLHNVMYSRAINQRRLSEKTRISPVMISSYVTGKTMPTLYNIHKIARALHCEIDDLIFDLTKYERKEISEYPDLLHHIQKGGL